MKKLIYKQQNKKYLKNYKKQVQEIRKKLEEIKDVNDIEIQAMFPKDTITNIALVSEMVDRMYGIKLYDVQLMSILHLLNGGLCEKKTGEGKTVVGAVTSLIKSLEGQVHLCTVNEYLARRDKELYEPLMNFFGQTCALNLQEDNKLLKKAHYQKDIVYGMGSTFGFDYLYDNMVYKMENKVQKERKFVLIDEVDLILIDEARTPLIVGAPFENNVIRIIKADKFVKSLEEDDYIVDKAHRAVYFTEKGEQKLQEKFIDIYTIPQIEMLHFIHQSLQANYLYQKDIDYAVIFHNEQYKVAIIDTYTGRIQPDRRFSNGLHQALEVKEGVEIQKETKTTGTITLQNYFRLYEQIAGMSGTVDEEREEFQSVYGLQTFVVPTNKPFNRQDNAPFLLKTKNEKWNVVLQKIQDYHKKQYPQLIGTSSVEESERLSKLLKRHNLTHVVLNAKQDANEAEIIAQAGKKGAITIATNMAGRGTDILVESAEHPLVVFVTELNESSRIDRQLKGRTSRQGAFGITETVLSAEDDIFKKVGVIKKLQNLTESTNNQKVIQFLTNYVQSELTNANASSRKQSLKYDDVIKEQRERFYQARDKVLTSDVSSIYDELDIDLSDRNFNNEELQHLLLYAMDKVWIDHIDKLESLKNAIGFRGASGHNPIILYQNESQILYDNLQKEIRLEIIIILEEKRKREMMQADAYKGDK